MDPDQFLDMIIDDFFRFLALGIMIFLLYKWIMFLVSIYRNKLLIDAFAQQVSDEIIRMDINSPIGRSEKMQNTMAQFTVDGLARVMHEQGNSLFYSGGDEAEVLSKVADAVHSYNEKKISSFLYERTTLRWCIDGLDSLIGDHFSIESAWSKGVRYLNRFIDEEKRNDLPFIPSYLKLLRLPHNFHHPDFNDRAKVVMNRSSPKGYLSLFIACKFFTYRSKLRLFNLRGEDAWKEIRRFKASTIDYETLKRD